MNVLLSPECQVMRTRCPPGVLSPSLQPRRSSAVNWSFHSTGVVKQVSNCSGMVESRGRSPGEHPPASIIQAVVDLSRPEVSYCHVAPRAHSPSFRLVRLQVFTEPLGLSSSLQDRQYVQGCPAGPWQVARSPAVLLRPTEQAFAILCNKAVSNPGPESSVSAQSLLLLSGSRCFCRSFMPRQYRQS